MSPVAGATSGAVPRLPRLRTLPDLEWVLASAIIVRVPLRVTFRGVEAREAVLLDGPHGWAEFAPFTEYPDLEAAWWLASALEAGWQLAVPTVRSHVQVNATVPAVPARQVAQVLHRYDGCRTVKVKVAEAGQTLQDDLDRVRAVREVAGEAVAIRVDANGGWSPEQALAALRALEEFGLEYAEQPCRGVDGLLALRELLQANGVRVPVAADESIRKAGDPIAVARAGAADVAVVKVAPLGGVRRVLALADELAAAGMRLVVSSALDTSIGLATGVRAAAALPCEPLASGLGTASLLADDVAADPLRPVAGTLPVRAVQPDPERLRRLSLDDTVCGSWWRERITRCHGLLAAAVTEGE